MQLQEIASWSLCVPHVSQRHGNLVKNAHISRDQWDSPYTKKRQSGTRKGWFDQSLQQTSSCPRSTATKGLKHFVGKTYDPESNCNSTVMVLTRKQRARSMSTDGGGDESDTAPIHDTKTKKPLATTHGTEQTKDSSNNGNDDDNPIHEESDSEKSKESENEQSSEEEKDEEQQQQHKKDISLSSKKDGSRPRLSTNTAKLPNFRSSSTKRGKNELTKLIPGYIAEMRLSTPSLDRYRPAGGIKALERRAELTDRSTKDHLVETTKHHTDAMQMTSSGFLPNSYVSAYSSFKKGSKRNVDESAGNGWFNMQPTPMTEELKTDLAVLRNRTYLDPKKFYKSADKHSKIVQLGTVIEGAAEYYSSRMTKKQRRSNITEEILADPSTADYATNKFKNMSRDKRERAKKAKRGKGKGRR
eukprot:scaffold1390_cov138-Cylindrotheca_fusiformis.AAC.29